MEELQVPTREIEVEVCTDDRRKLEGSFFLVHTGVESAQSALIELLLDDRAFLPFVIDDGYERRSVMLNKDHIVRMRMCPSDAGTQEQPDHLGELDPMLAEAIDTSLCDDKRDPIPDGQPDYPEADDPVHVLLTDGTEILGVIEVATPVRNSRLVDKLNLAQRFIPVRNDDGLHIIQSRHIICAY